MQSIEALLETLKKNEEIAKKFQAIETKILSILDFTGLFEILLDQIRQEFQIPYVWLTLIDDGDETDLMQYLEDSKVLETNLNVVSRETFFELVSRGTRPLLVNDNLKPYFRLFPHTKQLLIKSMAIAPITLEGRVIGSLNQGDFSPERFSPDIDPSLLEQLAVKVSLCLANVTAHEQLKFLAFHDPLTGSLNRRVMESILKREFLRAKRYHTPLSFVFLDIDYFKQINDRYGHDAGDRVLVYLARGIEGMVRNSDVVARYAGDEFVVVLPETTAEKARTMMARIKAYFLENPLQLSEASIRISISFGVSSNQEAAITSPEVLLKTADTRLYEMKEHRS